jgi:hypothetical protein
MSEFITRQQEVIERTGAGLLPGIGLAFALSMGLIAGIMFETWWALGLVLVGIFTVTAVVVAIIAALIGGEDDTYSHA